MKTWTKSYGTGSTGGVTLTYKYQDTDLVRSNSALRGWGTKYRKEIALLKKEQVDLRMKYDRFVSNPSGL